MPEYIILKRKARSASLARSPVSVTMPPDWNTSWEQLPMVVQAVDRQAAVEAHLETLPEDERSQVFRPISVRDWGDSFSGQATVTWSAEPVDPLADDGDIPDPPEAPEGD